MFSVHAVYLVVQHFRDIVLGHYINKDYHYHYYYPTDQQFYCLIRATYIRGFTVYMPV